MQAGRTLGAALWFWGKVLLCLLALDLAVFRTGWIWGFTAVEPIRGRWWFPIVQQIELVPPEEPVAYVIGSSIVGRGLSAASLEPRLRQGGQPGRVVKLSADGIRATGAALIARATFDGPTPWLVVYGAAARDFLPGKSPGLRESPFFDASVDLSALPRSANQELDAVVKSYWSLYRYRDLVRALLQRELLDLASWFAPTSAGAVMARDPAEAVVRSRFFGAFRSGPRAEAWKRWWRTRQPSDYLRFLAQQNGVLELYARQPRLEQVDLSANPEVDSLRWLLTELRDHGVHVVVAYFPENPFFRRQQARRYFDPRVSDAVAAMLAVETARAGADFLDLRTLLEIADFEDLLHPNLAGAVKITDRLGKVILDQATRRAPARGASS